MFFGILIFEGEIERCRERESILENMKGIFRLHHGDFCERECQKAIFVKNA